MRLPHAWHGVRACEPVQGDHSSHSEMANICRLIDRRNEHFLCAAASISIVDDLSFHTCRPPPFVYFLVFAPSSSCLSSLLSSCPPFLVPIPRSFLLLIDFSLHCSFARFPSAGEPIACLKIEKDCICLRLRESMQQSKCVRLLFTDAYTSALAKFESYAASRRSQTCSGWLCPSPLMLKSVPF